MGEGSAGARKTETGTDKRARQKETLRPLANAMEKALSREPGLEHSNRGLRAKISAQLPGGEREYLAIMQKAQLGDDPSDRARIARLAEAYPETFDTVNAGLGSMRVLLLGAPLDRAQTPAQRKDAMRPHADAMRAWLGSAAKPLTEATEWLRSRGVEDAAGELIRLFPGEFRVKTQGGRELVEQARRPRRVRGPA